MALPLSARRRAGAAAAALSASLLTACTFTRPGPPNLHYDEWKITMPKGMTVEVCSAYGCRKKTPFTFSRSDLQQIAEVMNQTIRGDNAAEERRAIQQAVAWIERRVGPATGTAHALAGIAFSRAGDPGQMDCVDEATNTTSYLIVMSQHGLLRHHTVDRPIAKGGFTAWPHYGAVLVEKGSGRRWVVDSSVANNGRPPSVTPQERWYVPG